MSGILNLSDVTLPAGPAYKKISDFLKLSVPVTSGLLGLYQFGGTEAASLVNLANEGAPLTKIGSPTINANSATLSRDNCFETAVTADPSAFTYLAVAKPTASGSIIVGNFADAAPNGASVFQTGTTSQATLRAVDGSGGLVGPTNFTLDDPDLAEFGIFIGRADATTSMLKWSKNGVINSSGAVGVAGRTTVTRNIRIGGNYSTTQFTGAREIAAAAIWNRALTDAEISAVVVALRQFYALGGVTTL